MKKILLLSLISMVLMANLVLAGDFRLHYGGSQIFTVTTGGVVNASGTISESGVLLSDTYLALAGGTLTGNLGSNSNISTSAYFVGDGSLLTNIVAETVAENGTTISYHNLTGIPTCAAEQYLSFDGTDLSCDSIPTNSVTIAGENITSGTVGEAYLPSTVYTLGLNASQLAVGTIPTARIPTLDYHNITNIPTCTGSDVLTYDGSDLSCTTPATMSYTNIALVNQSNTFTPEQEFTGYINATTGVRLMSDASVITRNGVETTNMSIDSSGNVNFYLG